MSVIVATRTCKSKTTTATRTLGRAHNEMIMAGNTRDLGTIIDDAGKGLV